MFVLLTIVAVLLALVGQPLVERRREQTVVRTIEAAGGRATVYDYVPRFGATIFSAVLGSRIYQRVREVDLSGTGFKDADLEQFHQLTHLRTLCLDGTKVADAGLQHLRRNANLESLNLNGTLVTDAGLQHLQELGSLWELNTSGTQITYEGVADLQRALPGAPNLKQQRACDELYAVGATGFGVVGMSDDPLADEVDSVRFHGGRGVIDLRHLQHLPRLRGLDFVAANVTGNVLSGLESVPQLEEIRFINAQVTNKDLEHLKPLTKLKEVWLEWSRIDDNGLAHLGGLSSLQKLYLNGTNVTGLGFRHLKGLSQLEVLDLGGCQYIYDADLKDLHCLKRLRRLVLEDARVTTTGVAQLQKALPNAQIIVRERKRRPQRGFGPTADLGLPVEAEAAFWDGDYETMARILKQFVTLHDSSWQGFVWLGHAYQLADKWEEAVGAYHAALVRLERQTIATPVDQQGSLQKPSREQLEKEWAKLVLLVGRIELDELKDPAAAAETLAKGLRFAPAAGRPIAEIATEAATVIDGLKSPYKTRPFNEHLWSDLMYPLTTLRYQALAHEQLGDIEAALECWLRIRLCRVGYKVAMANTDPAHIAALWSKLPESKPPPPMPVFSVLTDEQPEVTLKPNTGESRLTWWGSNRWDTFAVAARPHQAIASLEITCTIDRIPENSSTSLRCWADAASHWDAGKRRRLDHHWPKDAVDDGKPQTFQVDVPFDTSVLLVRLTADSSWEMKLRATLRPRGTGKEWPEAKRPPPSRRTLGSSIDFPRNPFRLLSSDDTNARKGVRSTSSLVRMPDGRFLFAFGEKKITFANSDDGVAWEESWEYEHNSIFPTGNPTVLVDDDGTIWMLYSSKRPGTDCFSSGHYYLWLAHSRDGHTWSTPAAIRTAHMLGNDTIVQLTRSPDGKYWILANGRIGSGDSPGDIRELQRLLVPIRINRTPTHVQATFDADGRCHLVFVLDDLKRLVQYSQSDDMRLWSSPRTLFKADDFRAEIPQLVIDGDRVALIYSNNKGRWIRRGTMQDEGPHLTDPIQFANHSVGAYGSRVMRESGKVYLPLTGDPPGLLIADLDDLLAKRP